MSKQKTVQSKNAVRRKKPVIYIGDTEYDIVKKVARDFNWKLSEYEDSNWDITWTDRAVPSKKLSKMKHNQKINHFPGMHGICQKHYLAWNLNKMQKLFPDEYNFYPRTWVLPGDYADLRQYANRQKTFIVKPEACSQGYGIYLINNLEDINITERLVVQEYISSPLLIESLKFDFRIYALIVSCSPLKIYVHEEGLARLATEKYSQPTQENFSNTCMHLTNYAINKNNPKFLFNKSENSDDVGHKRSLTSTFRHLAQTGLDTEKLKSEISDIICKTLCSVQHVLQYNYKFCQPLDTSNSMCFELLGFDIIVDSNNKPWLLEVNHSPSFTTDTPLDLKIKERLIKETLQIINKGHPNGKPKNTNENKPNFEVEPGMTEKDSKGTEGFHCVFPNSQEKYENFIQTAARSRISTKKKPADEEKNRTSTVGKKAFILKKRINNYSNSSIKQFNSTSLSEVSPELVQNDFQKMNEYKPSNFFYGKDLIYYKHLHQLFKDRRYSISFLKGTEFHSTVTSIMKPLQKTNETPTGSFLPPKYFEFVPSYQSKNKVKQ